MQALNVKRQQYVQQLQENEMAKEELDRLDDDAGVFKLIGPALVKQDRSEALDTLNKRLDFIRSTVERTEKELVDKQKGVEEKRDRAMVIRREMGEIQQRFAQMQQQMQQMAQQQQQQPAK